MVSASSHALDASFLCSLSPLLPVPFWPLTAHVIYAELGCRLVVVLGGKVQIDNYLNMRGLEPKNIGGYRITDDDAMLAAMEAAGTSRMLVEAQLSKVQPSVCCLCGVVLFFYAASQYVPSSSGSFLVMHT